MKRLSEENLIRNLKEAVKAEKIAGEFYRYLSKYILNDKVKNEFEKFADEEAVKHEDLLNQRLKEITGHKYTPHPSELNTAAKVRSFSLVDAFILAKDSEEFAVKFYKQAKRDDKKKHKKMYDELLKDERKHWSYLDRERRLIKQRIKCADVAGIRLYSFLKDCLESAKKDFSI